MPENGYWTISEKVQLYQMYLSEGRQWAKFAKIFNSTGPAVRAMFERTDWEAFLKENSLDLAKMEEQTDEVLMDGDPVEVEKRANLLIKQRQDQIIEKAEQRRVNEHIGELVKENLVIDKIVSAITKIPLITPTKRPKIQYTSSPQEAVMLFGCSHLGLAVNSEEVGGLGGYGLPTFKKRWERYVERVIRITDLHRTTHQINKLNIAFLGDIVHGSNDAGKWGFLHTEQNIVDQLFEASQEIPKGIIELAQIYPEIEISCVYGNHGRVGKYGTEKKFVNWDYVLYKFMETSLAQYKNIKFTIPRSPFQVMQVMDKKFLLIHGSGIRSYVGIPWYGITRTEAKYRSILDGNKSIDQMWKTMQEQGIDKLGHKEMMQFAFNYTRSFDYFILGHFHQSGEMETSSGGRIIMNSSFIGGDDYSINDLVAASVPSQKFFGINRHGKTWSYDIELER